MKPTIQTLLTENKNLQREIAKLTNHNSDLDGNLRIANSEIERLKEHLAEARQDAAVRRAENEAELSRLRHEAVLNAEILRLTRELMDVKMALHDEGVLFSKKPADAALMLNGKPVSRKAVEEAASYGIQNGFSSGGFIPAIKNVREQTGCGLKEAKDFCDLHFSHLKDPAIQGIK